MWEHAIPAIYASFNFNAFPVGAAGNAATAGLEQAGEAARIACGIWVFSGATGTGKTGLAVSVLRAVPERGLLWVDGFTLMVRLTEVAAGKRPKDFLVELERPDALCIDDLGYAISNETVTRRAATRALQELLIRREGKLTLITLSGHSSDQATYAEFVAWLRRVGRVIDLGSVDLREQLFEGWERPAQLSRPMPAYGGSAVGRLRQQSERLGAPSRAAVGNGESPVSDRALPSDAPAIDAVKPSFTICFITQGNRILLINRHYPPLMGLWNGVGGKLEADETPTESILREVREETGIHLPSVQAAGVVSWHGDIEPDAMYVFTAQLPSDLNYETPRSVREGILAWHDIEWICNSANEGVVSNIRRFLPIILAGELDLEHRLLYKDGRLAGYESNRVPKM